MNAQASIPIETDCRTVQQQMASDAPPLVVDCREADEHAICRIAGARLIPMSEIQQRLGELQPFRDQPIVIHCHHGGRSLRVAQWLRGQGYAHAQSMSGGIDQWSTDIDSSVPRY